MNGAQFLLRSKIIRDTVRDFVLEKVDLPTSVAVLGLAGISAEGAQSILETARANSALVESYKAEAAHG